MEKKKIVTKKMLSDLEYIERWLPTVFEGDRENWEEVESFLCQFKAEAKRNETDAYLNYLEDIYREEDL